MPFSLKNVNVTYQRLINKMFEKLIGNTMEVYIDDIMVKSTKRVDHLTHLTECFEIVRKYSMKLNPAKCTFEGKGGKFLGYLVTKRGIEVNMEKVQVIMEMKSPKSVKEVQQLIGHIPSLGHFLS
ncbi:UNVERIFIED_CONTAM: hypothetical protein Sradi_1728400 [Sesamum radiatum]|uniref:Reverse transcriptase domain-containing protein n=1 Tax=Sesamum radiatum TaxID=300843 RepID=A0AAW2TTZ0_SESRA